MLTAIWLFENHGVFLAKEHYFSSMLNECLASGHTETDLAGCEIKKDNAVYCDHSDSEFYQAQLQECRYHLLIYNSVMLALTPDEQWLVRQKYDLGHTSSEIIELPDAPNFARSSSSISRHLNQIIAKTNQLLKEFGIEVDDSS